MMKQKKISTQIVLLAITAGIGGLISLNWFLGKGISASMMNAEYLGSDGVVLQTKKNNCGPSALKMIFDFYGFSVPIEEIEKNVELTEKGSSMLALKKMAESKGLKAEGWRLSPEDFMKQHFPILLFVHHNHYIIVDSAKSNDVFIRDPAIGKLKISKTKLINIWNGETLIFYNPH
ncbi:MAG: cysteine peptidase family C39 domain-containing protein [Bacteroidota bacterium]|nr:cysteine peptidase family C39 domain-containing protein [Bacteroidota bacterium]